MLVLTRRLGERIRIGDDIVITLVDIKNKNAHIGIEAPKSIPIFREEIILTRLKSGQQGEEKSL